jgi:hypothetical protein
MARTRSRRSAKAAGSRFERVVADWEAEHIDDRIDRAPKRGAKDRGDISGMRAHGQKVTQELKNCARVELSKWMAEAEAERLNDGGLAAVVISKRHGVTDPGSQWVHMTLRDLAALITGERSEDN